MPSPDAAGRGVAPIEGPVHSLIAIARRSLEHGVRTGAALAVDPEQFPPELRGARAAFVTLRLGGELRGCIGTLEATLPLVSSVAHHAFKAGFRDPRFPPVTAAELPQLAIEISILSEPERLPVSCEAALLAALRPGIDGLILRDGCHAATFLPSVWSELRDPVEFVNRLMQKAGLEPGTWPDTLAAWRYSAKTIA